MDYLSNKYYLEFENNLDDNTKIFVWPLVFVSYNITRWSWSDGCKRHDCNLSLPLCFKKEKKTNYASSYKASLEYWMTKFETDMQEGHGQSQVVASQTWLTNLLVYNILPEEKTGKEIQCVLCKASRYFISSG